MPRSRYQVMTGVGALLVMLVLAVLLGRQAIAPDAAAVVTAGQPVVQAATGEPAFQAAEGQLASQAAGRPSEPAASGGFTVTLPSVMRYYDPAYRSPFGVDMYDNVDDAAGLQSMKAAGAKSATTMLYWAAIQPTQNGPLDWSSFDIKAQNAQAAGLDLFVLFTGNPSWAAQYPGGPVTDTQHLVKFVTLMAQRYNCDGVDDAPGHPCVHNWSFYAEPDNGWVSLAQNEGKGYWGDKGPAYAAMLEQISPAIHAIAPKAKVMIGGLAYDWFTTATPRPGPFVQSFLGDVLGKLNSDHRGEVGKYLDAVAFHYYPISANWSSIRGKAQEIRGIMAANGAGSLPLLTPEMGYWSSTAYGSSEAQQANWLLQTYARGLSVDIKLLSWYKVFDDVAVGAPADGADKTAGLFHLDGTPKLSYAAYQTLTRELGFAHYVGPYQAQVPDVEGYVFNTDVDRQKIVLWGTNPKIPTVRVTFPYTHLRVVTATGTEYDILDNQQPAGAPGDVDGGRVGQIQLLVDLNEPIYVERK